MGPTIGSLVLALVVLGVIFWSLERLRPALAGQRLWRTDLPTDLAYWFFTPLVTKTITRGGVLLAIGLLAAAHGVPLERARLETFVTEAGHRLQDWPLAAQVVTMLFLGDLMGYWVHRLFHRRALWQFHAVHHSSRQLDWLSSVRVHPVNDIASRLALVVPLLVLGFPIAVVAAYVPFLSFYAILLHANVRWSFGPLRWVLASPTFHRWHHTCEAEGMDKNFAGLFSFIDLLFGTFYMPADRQPTRFGVDRGRVPDDLLGQLLSPFRRVAPAPAAAQSTR